MPGTTLRNYRSPDLRSWPVNCISRYRGLLRGLHDVGIAYLMSALACEIFWLRCCTVVPEVAEPGFGGAMTPQMFVAQDQHREPGTKHGAKPVDPPTLPRRGNQFRPKRSRRVRARAG